MNEPSFGEGADEVREVVPYVTLRKIRDGYSWSVCVPAETGFGAISRLADIAIEADSYLREKLTRLGVAVDFEPPRRRS